MSRIRLILILGACLTSVKHVITHGEICQCVASPLDEAALRIGNWSSAPYKVCGVVTTCAANLDSRVWHDNGYHPIAHPVPVNESMVCGTDDKTYCSARVLDYYRECISDFSVRVKHYGACTPTQPILVFVKNEADKNGSSARSYRI